MKKIFKEAHKMTRKMVKEYGVNYKAQFAICLSYLLNQEEEGMNENVEKAKELLTNVVCSPGQKEIVISKFEMYNSVDTELAEKECEIKEVRQSLKNADLYTYEYGVERNFLGEGKMETKNMNLWQNYGKARIYFDLYIDDVLVQNNVYIKIK
ncbi:hypothetical protein [Anaerosalibacter massiliensis]|uniref:hypothetical protein n=1 Tax=Anaerosalibacter massiliensis TaxID=1347392 RepID=UPI0005B2A880|nr:hypothetical protein [Anaerosalibacter massiliensis]